MNVTEETVPHTTKTEQRSQLDALWQYPLMDAIFNRRSRRFAAGAHLDGGALSYQSTMAPMPLTMLEEAVLATAAAGFNGYVLVDVPFESGTRPESGGGNVMAALTGRTGASADAVHAVSLFIINDEGAYFLQRPQDLQKLEVGDLGQMARERRLVEVYQRLRIKLNNQRPEIPRQVPEMFPFNKWSTNLPGATYFLPISDLTGMYINVLLSAFDEQMALFVVDERNFYRPAGLAKFGKSRGGKLHDDPKDQRYVPLNYLEGVILEFVLAEQSFMLHNLSLVEQAMGLGGWTHYATMRDTSWYLALGLRTAKQKLSQAMGSGFFKTLLLNLLNKNIDIPYGLGLEYEGKVLIKPFCPPYYNSMEEAVMAFIDTKMSKQNGTLKDSSNAHPWKEEKGQAIKDSIPLYSDDCIAATIALCEYIYKRYDRFPAYFGPMRITLAHQAHHLDLSFYDKFYKPGAYTATQAQHMDQWHR
jgi:hypothetical protein